MMYPPYKEYVIVVIRPGGVVKRIKGGKTAPTADKLVRTVRNQKGLFGARWFPSKKAWMLYDCREVTAAPGAWVQGRRVNNYEGWKRFDRLYPNEDAATMHAIALTAL